MIIEFYLKTSQKPTEPDINAFETQIGKTLPEDYRQQLLEWNGGGVLQYNLEHVNFPDNPDYGLLGFNALTNSNSTIVTKMNALGSALPNNHIPIGRTRGGGTLLLCLENDGTYGNIKVMFSEGVTTYMSPSFGQFLEDHIEGYDPYEDED